MLGKLLIRDLRALFCLQASLMLATFLIAGGNQSDVRVQLVWLAFLLPGWLIAPRWSRCVSRPLPRYLHAMITSTALHGLLSVVAVWIHMSMTVYLCVWSIVSAIAVWDRGRVLHGQWDPADSKRRTPRLSCDMRNGGIPWQNWGFLLALMVFCASVYQTPRSNDIYQFILQQQDMLEHDSMQVSAIGMSAMGVDQAMPRWRAHLWHLLPSLLAKGSGIAVDQVLMRYGTIPLAFAVLLSLVVMVRGMIGRHVSYTIALVAILAPVLLSYRNYSAFNYSFRITNNFMLDKDFALFFLIPAVCFLASRWLQGNRAYGWMLIAFTPAIIRFHPLTAVYLVLVCLPLLIWKIKLTRDGVLRGVILVLTLLSMFAVVFALGDAQGNHEQIRSIIEMDLSASREGRPTHYWSGFYNSVPSSGMPSNTTRWVEGHIEVKRELYTGCGLLLGLHLSAFVMMLFMAFAKGRHHFRVLLMAGVTLAMLWGMWLVGTWFLTRSPHYTAGYERLHWFAYFVAICVLASTLSVLFRGHRFRRVFNALSILGILGSSLLFCQGTLSPLTSLRGINSLLDYELPARQQLRKKWNETPPGRSLVEMRPKYLEDNDRALLLDSASTSHYWLIRQGVFWCDPYVEAFALAQRGDEFLRDRKQFYGLLDRKVEAGVANWIKEKEITVLVDHAEDANDLVRELRQEHAIDLRKIQEGVWRVNPS